MNPMHHPIFIGETVLQPQNQDTSGEYVHLLNETFYKISHFDSMAPFFMSLVSSSNHWLFIASTGGLISWADRREPCAVSLLHRRQTDGEPGEHGGQGHLPGRARRQEIPVGTVFHSPAGNLCG